MPPIEPESTPVMCARGADVPNEPRIVVGLDETAENGQFGQQQQQLAQLFRIAGAEWHRRDGQLRVVLAPALAPAHGNARRARLRHLSQSQKSAEGEGPQLLALAGKSWQTRDRLWSRGC